MLRHHTPSGDPSAKVRRPRAGAIATVVVGAAVLVAGCGSATAASSTPGPTDSASTAAVPATTSATTSAASPVPSRVAASPAASAPASPATAGAALSLQQDFVDVVRSVNPSVVVIETASGLG